MLDKLEIVADSLVDLLYKNVENIQTMYIDYHKPYVSRIWFYDKDLDSRIFIHILEVCNERKEALYHPHKWDSAVKIIFGEYEMGVGHSETDEIPKTDCVLILKTGSCYSMTEKDGWHYVFPKVTTLSLMVIPNKLNGRKMPIEPEKKQRQLTRKEVENIFYMLREHDVRYRKLDVQGLVNLMKLK